MWWICASTGDLCGGHGHLGKWPDPYRKRRLSKPGELLMCNLIGFMWLGAVYVCLQMDMGKDGTVVFERKFCCKVGGSYCVTAKTTSPSGTVRRNPMHVELVTQGEVRKKAI